MSENKHKFENGDVVQLKSGGPSMTIYYDFGMGAGKPCLCSWFSGTEIKSAHFAESDLNIYRADPVDNSK